MRLGLADVMVVYKDGDKLMEHDIRVEEDARAWLKIKSPRVDVCNREALSMLINYNGAAIDSIDCTTERDHVRVVP